MSEWMETLAVPAAAVAAPYSLPPEVLPPQPEAPLRASAIMRAAETPILRRLISAVAVVAARVLLAKMRPLLQARIGPVDTGALVRPIQLSCLAAAAVVAARSAELPHLVAALELQPRE